MQQESNSIYNTVSIVFLILSLLICLVTAGWISGAVPVPGGLAPVTDVPSPTELVAPTFTPSATVTATPQPTWTPPGTPAEVSTEEAAPPQENIVTPTPES